ncbi:Ig-like domain-containing protein [Pseudomonas viridiflava]|uniref:Ig-like domain-containing protein n=1 Tax=Pseudomonas viridiflava TaxID=33069 RepID=UPI000F04FD0A|nr:Ig-like domain-containing protein [Pseudomonas viridiflava]
MYKSNKVSTTDTLAGDSNLVPPTVDISLNNEGLLPVSALTSPVTVTFPAWSAVVPNTSYRLLWDKTPIGVTKLINEDDQPGDILTLDIPVAALTDGKHSLAYRLVNLENSVQTDSQVSPVEIDRTAPGNPLLAPIILPPAIQNGLTSAELQALGNVLPGKIAGYSDMKEGDVIRTYWGTVEGPIAFVGKDDMGLQRVMVDFTREFLESIGDIEAPVYYTVTDLAGNLSNDAQAVRVKLQLQVLPELPLPVVKEAQGDTLDPVDASNGATVVVGASAQSGSGDRIEVTWRGPNASDSKEKTITDGEAGRDLEIPFSAALVEANKGQTVLISYSIKRANGSTQTSGILRLKIQAGLARLPAPTMDTVGPDGLLTPSNIPESGATVRVSYPEMSSGDSVFVRWEGTSHYDTPAQVIGADAQLQFNIPKAYIVQSIGGSASATYTVTRAGTAVVSAPLWMRVQQGIQFDTSPVTLNGKIYLIPASPELLPSFPPHTTVRRTASGGLEPYTYRSSDNQVAQVDATGMTSVRGKGTATISVTDARGQTASYHVSVTGVIHCLGLGSGSFAQMNDAASAKGARLPSSDELNQIFNTFGSQWPLGNGNYWSSTVAAQNLVGMKWYFVKNLVTGSNYKLKYHNTSLGVAIR